MRIFLSDGNAINMDKFVSSILRTDCTPVPASLEFQVILQEGQEQMLQEGSVVRIGSNYLEMKIVKSVFLNSGIIKDGVSMRLAAMIAVLHGCEGLINPASRAVYLENSSIGAALRASGNKIKVVEDVPMVRYFCALGATPTYEIARKCGEEAAVICVTPDGKIAVKRLSQIMDQEPVASISSASVQWVANPTQISHSIPVYQTINADGSTIEGSLTAGAQSGFYPNLDARRAKNLSTVLVTRGTVIRQFSPDLTGGQVILVDDKKYLILTAAHPFDTGILGAASVSATKIWLAEVISV